MSSRKSQILVVMVSQGFAREVLALLLGESKYNRADSPGAPIEKGELRLRAAAMSHLRFVAISGANEGLLEYEGHAYSGKPEQLNEWLLAGAPGVTTEELNAFVADHPDLFGNEVSKA